MYQYCRKWKYGFAAVLGVSSAVSAQNVTHTDVIKPGVIKAPKLSPAALVGLDRNVSRILPIPAYFSFDSQALVPVEQKPRAHLQISGQSVDGNLVAVQATLINGSRLYETIPINDGMFNDCKTLGAYIVGGKINVTFQGAQYCVVLKNNDVYRILIKTNGDPVSSTTGVKLWYHFLRNAQP